jgi:hypothetical protein
MRIKQLILTVLLILIETSLFAQNKKFLFGIGSSLDFNSYGLVKDLGPVSYAGKFGYSAGFTFRYIVNDKCWISSKLFYSTKKHEEIIDFTSYRSTDPFDQLLNKPTEVITKYSNSFIEIPIDFGYKLNSKKIELYSVFGLVNSIRTTYSGEGELLLFSNGDEGKYANYLVSAKLGLGLLFKMKGLGLYIEPQTRIYLNKVNPNDDQNPIQFGLELQLLKL